MNKLSNKEFKKMLYEWKELIKENSEESSKNFNDIVQMHKPNKTLYHITTYSPDYFKNGLQLKNATELSVKELSSAQGSGIYFFCNPNILEKAFSQNDGKYLLIVEKDYKKDPNFLPDFEICAGYFVDWYIDNIDRLSSNGFKSSAIRKYHKKGDPSPLYSSGFPESSLTPKKSGVTSMPIILSRHKTLDEQVASSGKIVHEALQEIKDFSQRDYEDAISYIMSHDIESVKYVGTEKINVDRIYNIDNNTNKLHLI